MLSLDFLSAGLAQSLSLWAWKRTLTGLVALWLVVGCWSLAVAGLTPPTILTTSVEPGVARIGDLLTLRIVATHEPGRSLKLGDLDFSPFELQAGPVIEQHNLREDRQQTTFTFVLTVFTVGRLNIPQIKFTESAAGVSRTLMSQTVAVEVQPLTTEADSEIKNVIDFREMPAEGRVQEAILILLVLMGLAFFGASRVRAFQKQRQVSLNVASDFILLEEEAIGNIKRLINACLAAQDDEQFYVELSVILRDYCVRRCGLAAFPGQTNTELLAAMSGRADKAVVEQFRELLQLCDLVKFARYRFDAQSKQQTARIAMELIREQAADRSSGLRLPGSERDVSLR